MTTLPLPVFDLAWVLSGLVVFFVLLTIGLMYRPELNNGEELPRMTTHKIGLGIVLSATLAMLTYRGFKADTWLAPVPQAYLDTAWIVLWSYLAAKAHRVWLGESRPGNPYRDLAEIERKAKELTDHATSSKG